MKTRTYAAWLCGALALTAATWGNPGRAQQGPASKVGDKLDEAGRAAKRGLEKAGDNVREGFAKTRESVHAMGVESRVYGRLHWDKALSASAIDLDVQSGGVATLRGTVPNAAAKTKAVALASDTMGVTKVIDQLAIEPAAKTVSETPASPR